MIQDSLKNIEELAKAHGFEDFKWINPREIITGHWVRTKCIYGCLSYGRKACCPPNTPSLSDCRSLFGEYQKGLLFHLTGRFSDPQIRHAWGCEINGKTLALERDVFLSGFHKAFIFTPVPCNICSECKGHKNECANPLKARPTLESYCVDVFATARKFGYPIDVLLNYEAEINRYGALFIE